MAKNFEYFDGMLVFEVADSKKLKVISLKYRIVFFIFILLTTFTPNVWAKSNDNIKTVTVTGEGDTESAALDAALRNAVEEVNKAMISSLTEIKDDELHKDEIKSISSSKVKEYKILSSTHKNKLCYVTIKAKVQVLDKYEFENVDAEEATLDGVFGDEIKALQEANRSMEAKVQAAKEEYNRQRKVIENTRKKQWLAVKGEQYRQQASTDHGGIPNQDLSLQVNTDEQRQIRLYCNSLRALRNQVSFYDYTHIVAIPNEHLAQMENELFSLLNRLSANYDEYKESLATVHPLVMLTWECPPTSGKAMNWNHKITEKFASERHKDGLSIFYLHANYYLEIKYIADCLKPNCVIADGIQHLACSNFTGYNSYIYPRTDVMVSDDPCELTKWPGSPLVKRCEIDKGKLEIKLPKVFMSQENRKKNTQINAEPLTADAIIFYDSQDQISKVKKVEVLPR